MPHADAQSAPAASRGRGRPAIGVRVHVHIPDDLLADIDAEAEQRGTTRADEIRRRCAAK